MPVINTNVNGLITQSALKANERLMATAMQQLSTGKRINSAQDDPAGRAIVNHLTTQILSLDQSVRNANDSIALLQVTDGAAGEISGMLQRMRELAVQAANDTSSNEQRDFLNLEFQQLKSEIVRTASMTQWNGLSILNGTEGIQVGADQGLGVNGNGSFNPALRFTPGTFEASGGGSVVTGGGGGPTKAGNLAIVVDASGSTAAATLTLEDGTRIAGLTASVANGVMSFAAVPENAALNGGRDFFTLTTSAAGGWQAGETVNGDIVRGFGVLPPLLAGDIVLNGEPVPATDATDDALSPALNAAASAIAKVAAINSVVALTGAKAMVGKTVLGGTAMTGAAVISGVSTGTVSINGLTSPTFTTLENDVAGSRAVVVAAINRMTALTGVTAFDSGSDDAGVRLEAADGRNIELAFNTASSDAEFAVRTGLRQGAQSGAFVIEPDSASPLRITGASAAALAASGVPAGSFESNRTIVTTEPRAAVGPPVAQVLGLTITGTIVAGDVFSITLNGVTKEVTAADTTAAGVRDSLIAAIAADVTLGATLAVTAGAAAGEIVVTAATPGAPFTFATGVSSAGASIAGVEQVANEPSGAKGLQSGDLVLNGVAIRATTALDDTVSDTGSAGSSRNASAIAIATAINSQSSATGVRAMALPVLSTGTAVDTSTPSSGLQSVFINGTRVQVLLVKDETGAARRSAVIEAINLQSAQHGVIASDNGDGVTLTAPDGRNLTTWFDADVAGLSAQSFGLHPGQVKAVAGAEGGATRGALTLYGGVQLTSVVSNSTVSTLASGASVSTGEIRVATGTRGYGATSNFTALGFSEGVYGQAPSLRVARMTFQVGPEGAQNLTIDLPDFGKRGSITAEITGDVDDANPKVSIASRDSAVATLDILDIVLDRVAEVQARMGASMNRLQHVADNLTAVSNNTTQLRSDIEDTDYASASSALARSQIVQQAAIAVLAQANSTAQSVLKLLQ